MVVEQEMVGHEPVRGVARSSVAWRRIQWLLLGLLLLVLIAVATVWLARKPIANNVVAGELKKRGVQATYDLDRIGLRTQQVSNLVIGDPANPDLTARTALVEMRVKWDGSVEFYRIAARGVRLKGRVVGNKVTWGQIDKLLPKPTGKPFTLPNIVVDVADTTIALQTPYGPLGFALRGRGNLAGGFKGKLAASAPLLTPGACRLEQLRASVTLSVEARRPHIVGPLGAKSFTCPASRLALSEPRMEIDSTFSEAFGSFEGKGRMSMASLVAGVNGLAAVNSNLTFKGSPTEISGAIDLNARKARMAQVLADRTNIKGRYRLDARRGGLVLVGDFGASSVQLAPSLMAGITAPLASAKGTPLAPIGEALVRAIDGAGRRFDVQGSMRMVNGRGGGGVRIGSARARSPAGAAINVSGGEGINYYWPSGRLRIDGDIATQGGGLPTARITLRQPRSGGPVSGTALIAPYEAGGSRIALAPVRFSPRADGWTQLSTVAVLDGPFGGGRVTGLRIPVEGRFGAGGALVFGQGCIDARFETLRIGALRLGPTRLPLCPTGTAILSRRVGSAVQFGVATRQIALRGRLGTAPFALDAAQARMLGQRDFEAAGLKLRLGDSGAPALINAATLRGTFSGSGISGTFAGGDGKIGRVPLDISNASGRWRFYEGDLTINGGLTVADAISPARFYPLRSDNMRFTLADGRIRTTGTLKHPASGTRVAEVEIDHRLSDGVGRALLDVPGIRFGQGLQPEELTRLTEGVVALVTGDLSGQGRISWAGRGAVKSTGEFTLRDTDLAARFGPVTGLNTTIRFTDLLGLETAPGQVATVKTINPGILVQDGVVRYSLLPGRLVRVERGVWPFMGGQLVLRETVLNFNRPTAKRLTFEVIGLNAKTFVDSMGFKEIGATGIFDGVLPMIFDDAGGRIVGGRLVSRPGGGTLAYNGVVNKANLGMVGSLAFDALRDLRFASMIIRLDGQLDGEFATRLTIEGAGLGNTSTQQLLRSINRIKFKFNVSIKGPFRALIATAKSVRDPQDLISGALPRPLKDVPGIVTQVRRIEEEASQTQTPVDEKITVGTKPEPEAPQ